MLSYTPKCAWQGCNNAAGKGKYCPSCAKQARAHMKDIFEQKRLEREQRDTEFAALYEKAHAAGMAALVSCRCNPMLVTQHVNPLNDKSEAEKAWLVPDGPCGFAWVTVRPATCSFAHWLKKHKGAKTAYHGGIQIWVHEGGQSIQRKEAYANAFAKILQEAGIKAYAGSRMD